MKSNHSLFSLATTSTQNSYFEIQSFSLSIRNYFYAKLLSFFSPWAHKCIVASAPVNNVSSFSSNSDNSLVSRAFLAISEANSDSKSNLVLKSHVLPVSIKPAAPMSVSNFCASPTLSNFSDVVVQKTGFDSYSFNSSSFTNSTSQRSFCHSKILRP